MRFPSKTLSRFRICCFVITDPFINVCHPILSKSIEGLNQWGGGFHYRGPEGSLSYFVSIFNFSNFVFNFSIFTSPFCLWVEIIVLFFSFVIFELSIFFSLFYLTSLCFRFCFYLCFDFSIFHFCFCLNCCGATEGSEQQHNQYLKEIYKGRRILEFITFYHNALHLTRVHCATNNSKKNTGKFGG